MAVHNLTEQNLRDAFYLGGLPMPSIAVVKAALEKLPVYRGTVYRHYDFDSFGGYDAMAEFLMQFNADEATNLGNYLSASTVRNEDRTNGEYTVDMVIQSETGRSLNGFGRNTENEVLLPRTTELIADSMELISPHKVRIIAREVIKNGEGATADAGTAGMRDVREGSQGLAGMRPVSGRNSEEVQGQGRRDSGRDRDAGLSGLREREGSGSLGEPGVESDYRAAEEGLKYQPREQSVSDRRRSRYCQRTEFELLFARGRGRIDTYRHKKENRPWKKRKKRIFSGIQPSGELTLGSYMGAIKNWVDLQDDYDCLYCIVDMHAITVRQDPATLRRRSVNQLAQYIACGLDPQKNIMFIQSHVPQHAELGWVLGCYTQFGELSRMTQFKAKSKQHADNITSGLFTYPVLMAADILLYQTDLVPVGEDQKQHVELCRDIAQRFNGLYSDTFTLPEPFIPKVGARVMSLSDPTSKMSKSDPDGCVFLMDKPEDIMRKFKRAVTDCETAVKFDKENKAGISNLLSIYCAATGKTLTEAEKEFAGQGYGIFKPAVGESVVELLRPIREESERIMADKAYLEGIYKEGASRAEYLANKTLSRVFPKAGLAQPLKQKLKV